MLALLLFAVAIVQGQLSVDDLFSFHSKHARSSNCSGFQYKLDDLTLNAVVYNHLSIDCNGSRIILRNKEAEASPICPNDKRASEDFSIYFRRSSQIFFNDATTVQVNPIRLYGIELCSLDEFIHGVYPEHSSYRSRWALLINLENTYEGKQHRLAVATNGEMTFLVFVLSSDFDTTVIDNDIELSFPNENLFKFNRSSIHVWRVDQGYAHSPKSMDESNAYQLSKSKFTLFNNETFFVYGTQVALLRRLFVSIDDIALECYFDHILRCVFPILPLNLPDTHQPRLIVAYNRETRINTTLTLVPRTRLQSVPTNHSIFELAKFELSLTKNLCTNTSLRSVFHLIAHLWREDAAGVAKYQKFINEDLPPVTCNATVKIGQEVQKMIGPISIDEILSLDVDITHRWYEQSTCRPEHTRVAFL